jgi:RNA polymerase sigma factor for flagellar operon FliA
MQALADLAVGLALGFMLDGSGLVVGEDEVDRRPTAYESLAWKDLLRRVHAELEALPHRERLIIRGHYLEGMDFQQLSALLGVSKGRISQLHRGALDTIRVQLGKTNDFILQR